MQNAQSSADWIAALAGGDRRALATAITLIESTRSDDQDSADELLRNLPQPQNRTLRLGITGVPGVGKSTFIESLGNLLLEQGHRVAVLAIDPSSPKSGGSVLGDKTRMNKLAGDTRAFIRPSPSRGALGGVQSRTADAILLCECAGFDVVIVETVGVGQSEVAVADLVDLVVWLALPGAGDELQGVKRGIMEVADIAVVHKADGDRIVQARLAKEQLESALMMLSGTRVPVLLASSVDEGESVADVWKAIDKAHDSLNELALNDKRAAQKLSLFDSAVTSLLTWSARAKHQAEFQAARARASSSIPYSEARTFVAWTVAS